LADAAAGGRYQQAVFAHGRQLGEQGAAELGQRPDAGQPRLRGAQGGASYLLGTMHIADPRVMEVMTRVRPEFDAARRFVLEVVLDQNAMLKLGTAMFYSDGRKLSSVAGPALFHATEARLAGYGVAGPLADSIKPWAAFTTLSLPASGAAAPPLDLAHVGEFVATDLCQPREKGSLAPVLCQCAHCATQRPLGCLLRHIGTPRRARQRKAVEAVEILVEEASKRMFVAGEQTRHEGAIVLAHRQKVRQAGGRRSIGHRSGN